MVRWMIVGESDGEADGESDGEAERTATESADPNSKGFPTGILGIFLRTFRDTPSHFREYN